MSTYLQAVGYVDDDELIDDPHPAVAAGNQITEAVAHLQRHPASLVRWPFPELDALTGPMGPGEVWFTAAFSGGGKTTFVVSVIDAWRREGKRVYVMPLELQPYRFRTYLACMELGIHPGDALSGALRADPTRELERKRLIAALNAQVEDEYVDRLRIDEQRAINLAGLEAGLRKAAAFQADVVVIDHIDHIAGGDGTSLYSESVRVNDAALRMAQDNGLLLWFTSQLNMDIARGKDHLAKFGPPMQPHLMFPTAKLKNATGIVGLFRPIRAMRSDETKKDYEAFLKTARAGAADAPKALETGVVGVNAMKLRNYGAHEGRKILLGFEKGRVLSLPERDRWTTTGGQPRQLSL
jgi:hypothetical protein